MYSIQIYSIYNFTHWTFFSTLNIFIQSVWRTTQLHGEPSLPTPLQNEVRVRQIAGQKMVQAPNFNKRSKRLWVYTVYVYIYIYKTYMWQGPFCIIWRRKVSLTCTYIYIIYMSESSMLYSDTSSKLLQLLAVLQGNNGNSPKQEWYI